MVKKYVIEQKRAGFISRIWIETKRNHERWYHSKVCLDVHNHQSLRKNDRNFHACRFSGFYLEVLLFIIFSLFHLSISLKKIQEVAKNRFVFTVQAFLFLISFSSRRGVCPFLAVFSSIWRHISWDRKRLFLRSSSSSVFRAFPQWYVLYPFPFFVLRLTQPSFPWILK